MAEEDEEVRESPKRTSSSSKKGLMSGAQKYFGRSRSKSPGPLRHNSSTSDLSSVEKGSSRSIKSSQSERSMNENPAAETGPSTPRRLALDKKLSRRVKKNGSSSLEGGRKKKDKSNGSSSKRTMSTVESSGDTPPGSPANNATNANNGDVVPATPKAKQKIRRRTSLMATSGGNQQDDARSVPDTAIAAISPTKKKKKRRNSMGAMDRSKARAKVGSREKKGKSRSKSSATPTANGLNSLMAHLVAPIEADLQDTNEEAPTRRSKSRTTVGTDGKIRRVSKNGSSGDIDGAGSDGEETKKSMSSKVSKNSTKSTSTKSRRLKEKEKEREKERERKKRSGSRRSDDEDGSMDRSGHSHRSDRSGRSHRSKRKSEPKEVEPKELERESVASHFPDRETLGSLPKFDTKDVDFGPGGVKMNDSFSSYMSDVSSVKVRTDLVDIGPAKVAELEREVDTLNKAVVELKEDQLKVQFQAQSEAAKLRKELREEKLELQRSQTERRELRAELRERDFIIDESDRKIEALEKAVESQLDKVEDLEDELKRANEEIFVMEEKLSHMETVLAESEVSKVNGEAKERDFDEKRQERSERRLEEREKELEERERRLREERDEVLSQGPPKQELDQLEQDNIMLLKAFNREQEEASDVLKGKDGEIEALKKELKEAKMRSFSHIVHPSTGVAGEDGLAQLMKEQKILKETMKVDQTQASATVQKKDDTIAFLEIELQRLKRERESEDAGDFDRIKRDLDATRSEAQAMKSKYDSAQRRNHILEDDIDHWKSVNCNVEDELEEWKSQAASWRAKYENEVDADLGEGEAGNPELNILPFSLSRGTGRGSNPAEISMMRSRHDSDEDQSVSSNAITNLWSKLTTPTSKKPTLSASGMSTENLSEVLARSTFH